MMRKWLAWLFVAAQLAQFSSSTIGVRSDFRAVEAEDVTLEVVEVDFEEHGDELLLQIVLPGESNSTVFELRRAEVYARESNEDVRTFKKVVPGRNFVTATVMPDGNVFGVVFDAANGHAWQFSHVDRFRRQLQQDTPDGPYLAHNVSMSELCGSLQDNRMEDEEMEKEKAAEREAHEHKKGSRRLRQQRRQVTSDSLVMFGGDSCFPGDDEVHVFYFGLVIDESFKQYFGSRSAAKREAEAIVAAASSVFEYQMNVILQISSLKIAGDSGTSANIFTQCFGGTGESLNQLENWADDLPESEYQGTYHLLTNCYPLRYDGTPQVVGTANVRTAGCRYNFVGWNTAVSTLTKSIWMTFAHEFAHNFGAGHSSSSGLMNSRNRYIDGFPRFQDARLKEMCGLLTYLKDTSCKFFSSPGRYQLPTSASPELCDFATKSECDASSAPLCQWDDTLSACTFKPYSDFGTGSVCRFRNKSRKRYYSQTRASSMVECMTKCEKVNGCKGTEFHAGRNRCRMWKKRPDSRDMKGDENLCLSLHEDGSIVSLSGPCDGKVESNCNGNCRWSPMKSACIHKRFAKLGDECMQNNNDSSSFWTSRKFSSEEACLRACDESCYGVEYKPGSNSCLLWNTPITKAKSASGRSCFTKLIA